MYSRNTMLITPALASDFLRTARYKDTRISLEIVKEKAKTLTPKTPLTFWLENGHMIAGHEDMLAIIFADITIPCTVVRVTN